MVFFMFSLLVSKRIMTLFPLNCKQWNDYALQALPTTSLPDILNDFCNIAINFTGNTISTTKKEHQL